MSTKRHAFSPPLDAGIKRFVEILSDAGIETCESCQGGKGHAYAEPTIRFLGGRGEGFRALGIAMTNALPIAELRRTWPITDDVPVGPYWELVFFRKAGKT